MNSASLAYRTYRQKVAASTAAQAAAAMKPPQPVGGNTPPQRFPFTVGAVQQPGQTGKPGSIQPTQPAEDDTAAAAAQAKQQAEQQQQADQMTDLTQQNQQLTQQVQKLEIEKDLERQRGELGILAHKAKGGGSGKTTTPAPHASLGILSGHVKRMRKSIPKLAMYSPVLLKQAVDAATPQINPGQTAPVPAVTPKTLPAIPITNDNSYHAGEEARMGEARRLVNQSPTHWQDAQTVTNKAEDEYIRTHPNITTERWGTKGMTPEQLASGDRNAVGQWAGQGVDKVRQWWYGSHGLEDTAAAGKDLAHGVVRDVTRPLIRMSDAWGRAQDNAYNLGANAYQLGRGVLGQGPRGFSPNNTNWWAKDVGEPLAAVADNALGVSKNLATGAFNMGRFGLNGVAPAALGWMRAAPAIAGMTGMSMIPGDDAPMLTDAEQAAQKVERWDKLKAGPTEPGAASSSSHAPASISPAGSTADWNPVQALNSYGYQGFGDIPRSEEYQSRYHYQDPRMEMLMNRLLPQVGYGAQMLGMRNVVDPTANHEAFASAPRRPMIDPRISQLLPMWQNLNQYNY